MPSLAAITPSHNLTQCEIVPWTRRCVSSLLVLACMLPAALRGQAAEPAVTMLAKPKQWVGLSSFAFGPSGKYLAAGTDTFTINGRVTGGDVLLWTIKGGKLKKTMPGHRSAVTAVAFRELGKQLVSISAADGEVRVFELRRGKQLSTFQLPGNDPSYTALAPVLAEDGNAVAHFAQGTLDVAGEIKRITGDLAVWDVATGKVRWRRKQTHAETGAISSDGSLLAYYAQETNFKVVDGKANYSPPNSVVHILNMGDGSLVRTIQVGWMPVNGLAFTADNSTLFAVNEELRRFTVATGKLVGDKVATDHMGSLNWLRVTPDGHRAAFNAQLSNQVKWLDLAAKSPKFSVAQLLDGVQPPMCFDATMTRFACEIEGEPALLDFTRKGKSKRRNR